MRFAKVSSTLALILFFGGATRALDSWAVSAACLVALVSAVVAAIAMEGSDLDGAEGLAAVEPLVEPIDLVTPAGDTSLEAA